MFLKKIFPKSLFWRLILIFTIPTIITQLIVSYIFLHRHWGNVNASLVENMAGEINAVIIMHKSDIPIYLRNEIENNMLLVVKEKKIPLKMLEPKKYEDSYISNLAYVLDKVVKEPFIINSDGNRMEVTVQLEDKLLDIFFHRRRIDSYTTDIFILWLVGTTFFFFIVSFIFSKKQIRPIIRLARATENFGKGGDLVEIIPEGALEIRKATNAFIKMQKRIERYISQRTEMLAGISHDLRTPLTRMKLRLAMQNKFDKEEMNQDITLMEKMINTYLSFARGQKTEDNKITNLKFFIEDILTNYKHLKIKFLCKNPKLKLSIKQNSMQRAILNIIDNAAKHSKDILITCEEKDKNCYICIHDNGIGVEESEYENIFKPFYRVDQSRGGETGSVGLGLAVVKDVINLHGGEILVERSEILGGAKFIIILAV